MAGGKHFIIKTKDTTNNHPMNNATGHATNAMHGKPVKDYNPGDIPSDNDEDSAESGSVKDVKSVSLSNDKFSTKLYNLLRKQHPNLVFSPFSLSVVMAMLDAGARGKTQNQIKKGLFFPPSATLQAEYKIILPSITSTQDFTFETANKVFIKRGFSLLDDFKEVMINSFHSKIQDIDFGNSEAAAKEINGWVEERTNNKIKDLIEPNIINADTCLVLVNAIYFKSNWAKKFDNTFVMEFQISPSSSVDVQMMYKSDIVFSARLDILSSTMVELPYKGDRIVMQVLLPDSNLGLDILEYQLKDVEIHDLFEKNKFQQEFDIYLPKFKLETNLPLNQDLQNLHMKNMFIPGRADFSGIAGGDLYVSQVIQQAIIEVDEEGTEAAAATAAVLGEESAGPMFKADHPFIFYLRDKESGMLMFQGRVINPLK